MFPVVVKDTPPQFFAGRMENLLTCLNLIPKVKGNVLDGTGVKFFEEAAINAIYKTLQTGIQISDLILLIYEMPKILNLPYPTVKDIRDLLIQIIPQLLATLRVHARWQDFVELDYKLDMLKNFKI